MQYISRCVWGAGLGRDLGGVGFLGGKNSTCKGPLRLLGRKEHVFLESRLGCLEYRRRNLEKLGIGCYSERFIWINSILTKPLWLPPLFWMGKLRLLNNSLGHPARSNSVRVPTEGSSYKAPTLNHLPPCWCPNG